MKVLLYPSLTSQTKKHRTAAHRQHSLHWDLMNWHPSNVLNTPLCTQDMANTICISDWFQQKHLIKSLHLTLKPCNKNIYSVVLYTNSMPTTAPECSLNGRGPSTGTQGQERWVLTNTTASSKQCTLPCLKTLPYSPTYKWMCALQPYYLRSLF